MFDAGHRFESRLPEHEEPVLDRGRLEAQTLGDPSLARTVLEMFLDQSSDVLRRVRETQEARARAEAAHLLKGSSRAIGAARVAAAAQRVEDLPPAASEGETLAAIAALHASVAEARAAIAATLDTTARGL